MPPNELKGQYGILLCSYLVASFGYAMVNANIAPYADSIGVTGWILGVFPGLMAIASLVSRPFSGWVSDHFNRKHVALWMLLSLALVFVAYAFTVNTFTLVCVRITHGLLYALFTTGNIAMIADVMPRDKITRGMGYYSLCGNIVSAFAPALGVSLQADMGYQGMFLCAAAAYLVSFALSALLQYRPSERKDRAEMRGIIQAFLSVKTLPIAMIGFCNAFANGAIMGMMLVFAAQRDIIGGSIFFTVYALVSVAVKPLSSRVVERAPARVIILSGDFVIIASLVSLYFATGVGWLIAAGALFGIGYGGLQPILQGMSMSAVSQEERGRAGGTLYFGLDAGNGLGPMLCGVIAAAVGGDLGIGFLAMAVPTMIGMGFCLYTTRKNELQFS